MAKKIVKKHAPKPKKQIGYVAGPPNNHKASTVIERVDIEDGTDPETMEVLEDIRKETVSFQKKIEEVNDMDFTDLGVNIFDYLNDLRDEVGGPKFGAAGIKWMRDTITQVHDVADLSVEEKVVRDEHRMRSRTSFKRVGWMYMFNYQPLYREKLPYWDTFPVIWILKLERDGFVGINLHYLPIELRQRLFLSMMTLVGGSTEEENTRLILRYKYLMTQPRFRWYMKPCIKKYFYRRMDSYILKIPARDWLIASFLPIARFKKKHRTGVWKETRIKIIRDRLHMGKEMGYTPGRMSENKNRAGFG